MTKPRFEQESKRARVVRVACEWRGWTLGLQVAKRELRDAMDETETLRRELRLREETAHGGGRSSNHTRGFMKVHSNEEALVS